MGYVLKKAVQVAGDGDPVDGSTAPKTIDAGTPLEAIPASELAQLCGEHFVDSESKEPAGDDAHPDLGRLAAEAAVVAAASEAAAEGAKPEGAS